MSYLVSPSITSTGTTKVKEKEVAVLECNVFGEPKPVITWQRNGIRVETGLRYIVKDGSLKIIDTQNSDSGIYGKFLVINRILFIFSLRGN